MVAEASSRCHIAQRGRADDDRLLTAVVGEVLEQLLADPGLAQAHAVGDEDAVVPGEDPPGLLHGILLEFRQVHGAAARPGGIGLEVLLEILEERLGVDLVRGVFLGAELAGVEQLDEISLEVDRLGPLLLVPPHQVRDGPGPDLALDEAAGVVGDFRARRVAGRPVLSPAIEVTEAPGRLGVVRILLGRDDAVDQVQLPVADEPRPGEVARPDDRGIGPQAIGGVVRPDLVLVEEVRLGVQEALVEEPDLDLLGVQEGDQVLDQRQGLGGVRLRLELAPELALQRRRPRLHPDIRARLGIGADQEPEGPEVMEAVLDQAVARDGEVGRGDVEGPGDAPIEQALQRVGEAMVNIVDNKGDRHGLGSSLFGRVRFGLRAGFADAIDFDHATIFSASALHLCRKAVSGGSFLNRRTFSTAVSKSSPRLR